MTASKNSSLIDKNHNVKKILEDDRVISVYEKSKKRDKQKEMEYCGLVDRVTKVRRCVPAVKLGNIEYNNQSTTTFNT